MNELHLVWMFIFRPRIWNWHWAARISLFRWLWHWCSVLAQNIGRPALAPRVYYPEIRASKLDFVPNSGIERPLTPSFARAPPQKQRSTARERRRAAARIEAPWRRRRCLSAPSSPPLSSGAGLPLQPPPSLFLPVLAGTPCATLNSDLQNPWSPPCLPWGRLHLPPPLMAAALVIHGQRPPTPSPRPHHTYTQKP